MNSSKTLWTTGTTSIEWLPGNCTIFDFFFFEFFFARMLILSLLLKFII
jgi:hypothetical protein